MDCLFRKPIQTNYGLSVAQIFSTLIHFTSSDVFKSSNLKYSQLTCHPLNFSLERQFLRLTIFYSFRVLPLLSLFRRSDQSHSVCAFSPLPSCCSIDKGVYLPLSNNFVSLSHLHRSYPEAGFMSQ